MATSMERILCLVMTVLGPLTTHTPSQSTENRSDSRQDSGYTALRSLLGRSVYSIFSCVEWKTLKEMISAFGSVEHCLRWLGLSIAIPEEDLPHLRAGAQVMKEWEAEYEEMTEDLEKLKNELERTREKCAELVVENAGLRQKCTAYSEAGVILEQDRQQLQSLLTDKCRLLEENQHLEREISSLQELLEYATECVVDDEDGLDGQVDVESVNDLSDGEYSRITDSPLCLDDEQPNM